MATCTYKDRKTVNLFEDVSIDGTVIHQFKATIDSDDPTDCKISEIPFSAHSSEYRANRDEITEKYKTFQDTAWALSDEMAAEKEEGDG